MTKRQKGKTGLKNFLSGIDGKKVDEDKSKSDITSDNDIEKDVDSDVKKNDTKHETNDTSNDSSRDTSKDITNDVSCDITSNDDTYITQLITDYVTLKTEEQIKNSLLPRNMRPRYIDTHKRKTWYYRKDILKKIDEFQRKTGFDASYIVNMALDIFFKLIEERKDILKR